MYAKAVKLLTERYGKNSKIFPAHMRAFYRLLKIGADKSSLRQFMEKLKIHIRRSISDNSLFRERHTRDLGLRGMEHQLKVIGTGRIKTTYTSQRIDLKLRTDTVEIVTISDSTLPCVATPVPVVDWKQLKIKWSHVRDLPLRSEGGRVDILIGLDYAHLLALIECRGGKDFEPVAPRNRLSWLVRGVIGKDKKISSARPNHTMASSPEFDPINR